MAEDVTFNINVNGNVNEKIGQVVENTTKATEKMTDFQKSIAKLRDSGMAFDTLNKQAEKIGGLFGKMFDAGMENELQKQNLTTLLGGDVNAADTLFGKIAEYGKDTVYDKAGLIEAQKTMMSFGIQGEKAFGILKNIGDISMGDGNKMQSLALAFSQCTSSGKLMGQDLLQMINAGFNPLQIMSEKTGKSMATLKDEMSKGAISADMVAQSFQWATEQGSLFYQGAAKAGQTTAGRLNQLKDSAAQMATTLFDTLQPAINKLMDIAGKAVNFMARHQTVILIVTALLGTAALVVGAMSMATGIYTTSVAAATAATAVWTGIQKAFNVVMGLNPVVKIAAVVVTLIAVIAAVCSQIEGWGSLWAGVTGFMKYTFYAFVDGVKLYYRTLIDSLLMGLDKLKLGWYKFKQIVGAGDSGQNRAAIARINADVEARKKAIGDGAKKVVENVNKAKAALKGIKMGWKSDEETPGQSAATAKSSSAFGAQEALQNSVNGSTGKSKNKSSNATHSTNAIATGGTRNTQVTIQLGALVKDIHFTGTTEENAKNLTDQVASALLRVLNIAEV